MTPPLDENEESEDSRSREAQARRELEEDGCPPCYPSGFEITQREHLPEEYRAIVDYWLSFPGTGDVPLCAQRTAWRRFRAFQQTTRRRCLKTKRFNEFEDGLNARRRRHGLDDDVSLTMELERQSQMERWVEFQDYQLMRLEELQKSRDDLEKELDMLRDSGEATSANTAVSRKGAADDIADILQLLENAGRDLTRHEVLLQWIEQTRQAMDPGRRPTAHSQGHHDKQDALQSALGPTRRAATGRARQKRQPEPRPILGKTVRVSKPDAPPKRKLRPQKARKAPAPDSATTQNSDAVPQRCTPNTPKSRDAKRPKTRPAAENQTLRRQLRPRRVAKTQTRSLDSAGPTPPKPVRRSERISRAQKARSCNEMSKH